MKAEADISPAREADLKEISAQDVEDILADYRSADDVTPMHPGELYRIWVMERRNLKVVDVARLAGISREMLHRILRGDAPITARTALGLAEAAKNEPEFWLRAQMVYDLWRERERRRVKSAACA
ncbi:HigA family addiction module antitoxin [Afifella sp. JA880]|uniref:HigA family addiction module antitoxin n=1 Tax=Afifella sp. JA880 TaxID=2975280 RepID=UPI0021BB592E|nr:HigA family addiction module antitoxin [Afifella sp. JA880]MCT8268169.1 HigA family addiction module antitoxin [Afifella sp. JA880]